MKVTLLIPTRNEIDGLKIIMPRIKKEWVDEIIILDDGSTDGTIEYAKKNGYFVYIQKGEGLRKGYIEVLKYVTGDVIITFSPDGNCIPELIPALVEKMEEKEGYDMVIASRYYQEAKSEDDTFLTFLGNQFFTGLINIFFGHRYYDAMGIYRAYKKDILGKVGILLPRSNFYEKYTGRYISFEPQLSIRSAKQKLEIAEIPGDEPKRISDECHKGLLPASRINHFRVGFACLCLILDELFRK